MRMRLGGPLLVVMPAGSKKNRVKPAQHRKTNFQAHVETNKSPPSNPEAPRLAISTTPPAKRGRLSCKVVDGHIFVSSTSASETTNLGNRKRNKVLKLRLFAFGLSQCSVFGNIPFPHPEIDRSLFRIAHLT
jgi:hypothetical protein